LIHNDGNESKLLVLTGTIPIVYKGVTYNIPIDIYIPETHPVVGPKLFVRPTSNMIVQSNHKNVDSEGLVNLPYLNSWSSNSSLLDLIHILCAAFSNAPPLYTKSNKRQDNHVYANNNYNNSYSHYNSNSNNNSSNNNNNNNNSNNRNMQGTIIGISNDSNIPSSRRQLLIDDVTKKFWNQLKSIGKISQKVLPEDIVFISLRDFEKEEKAIIEKHGIKVIPTSEVRRNGAENVSRKVLRYLSDCTDIYVSFDVDSLDSTISKGTGTPVGNGLREREAEDLISKFMQNRKVCCFEITEVNPTLDKENLMAEIAFNILQRSVNILMMN